jgi:hypothetical protein
MCAVTDPFDGWEPSRDERRLLRQMGRLDRRRPRVARRTVWQTLVPGVLVVVLLGAFGFRLWHDPAAQIIGWTSVTEPGEGELQHAVGGGTYRFMATQDGSDEPVTYDPCETIEVVVNPRTAPPDADAILATALAHVSEATGLEFEVVGTTDVAPYSVLDPRTGDGWRPVQVSWSDSAEVPGLDGETIGLGGSAMTEQDGHLWYVSGEIALDGPRLAEHGTEVTTAVLQHELGHVLGLHHVEDEFELMHPVQTTARWGRGDLAGLAILGDGRCR